MSSSTRERRKSSKSLNDSASSINNSDSVESLNDSHKSSNESISKSKTKLSKSSSNEKTVIFDTLVDFALFLLAHRRFQLARIDGRIFGLD